MHTIFNFPRLHARVFKGNYSRYPEANQNPELSPIIEELYPSLNINLLRDLNEQNDSESTVEGTFHANCRYMMYNMALTS